MHRALATAATTLLAAGAFVVTAPEASAGIPPDLLAGTFDSIISFNSTAPAGTANEIELTNLPDGAGLRGIDVRPSTQVVYGVFSLGDGSLAVATIDHVTGTIGTLVELTLNGSTFLPGESPTAVDFNPVADRLRLLTMADDSWAVDVDTGAVTVSPDLNGIVGAEESHLATGAAYTGSAPGPAPQSTVLYDVLDLSQSDGDDSLVTQVPSTGALTLVGPLGRNLQPTLGFEITAGGVGWIAASERQEVEPGGLHARTKAGAPEPTSLYSIDLATGATDAVGLLGDGSPRVNTLTSFPVQLPTPTTTSTTAGATTTTTAAVSPTTVLARTGGERTTQGVLGAALLGAGGLALVAAARLRRRAA